MADGLSVAASVIAVVQLAAGCLKLSEKWIGSSDFSSPNLASLKTTLHGFSEAIIKFQTRLSAPSDVQSRQGNIEYLPQVLERSNQALIIVESFMNNRGLIGKYVVAPRFDGKLNAALKALDAAKELFLLTMHADNQAILLQTQQCLTRFGENSKFFQADTTNVLKRMHENAEEEGRANKRFREDWRVSQDTTTNSLKRLEENISKMTSIEPTQEAQRGKLMESLKFDQIDARHSTIKNAHARTCKWVLDNPEYNDWLDSDKLSDHCGLIWIKGKPGAGKSTLMKFLLAQAKKKMENTIILSFFFNARGGDLEKSTVGMYRSLLFQLLKERPELEDVQGPSNIANFGDGYEWTLEPLKAMLQEVIQGLAQYSLMCFIDALDECDEAEIRNMISFFESLGEQATSIQAKFRVCFSSRHYPHITINRGLTLVLEGQEGHTQDLIHYVETELKIGKSKLAQLIRTELREKAQGVFMWVVLVVEILNKEHDRGNIHKLRKRLQDIPGDLHNLFRSILTRDDGDRKELLLCVQWVLFAREPLRPEQLRLAIACEYDRSILQGWTEDLSTPAVVQMAILNSSKGLIEITKSKIQTVQFIHESVKDFLLKNNGLQEIWSEIRCDLEGKSHERLKQCCLVQMDVDIDTALDLHGPLPEAPSQEGKRLRQSANRKFPFLEYATRNVLYHADKAEDGGISQRDFLSDFKARRANWTRLNNLFEKHEIRRYVEPVSLSYVFAELNLAALIRTQPREQSCFDVEGSRYGLPLFAALATQSRDAVTALLEVEARARPGNIPLQKLARNVSCGEGEHMVSGRDLKFSQNRDVSSYAAEYGWVKTLAFFIGSGQFDIEFKTKKYCTPLILAAKGGHMEVVKLLLENRANVEAEDRDGMTPLQHACREGHEDVVKFLINKGADLGTRDLEGKTLLISACGGEENMNVLEILLENGADLEARDKTGQTPLIRASRAGKEHGVKFLLEKGARIEAQDYMGYTPLIVASQRDWKGAVKILLEKGANIEAQNKEGGTPLICASRHPAQEVVEILLKKGAKVEAQDSQGRTALISALKSPADAIDNVRILIERGANIEAKDGDGCTALMLAARGGRMNSVELLLEKGASIDMGNLSAYWPEDDRRSDKAYELILKKAEQAGWTAS